MFLLSVLLLALPLVCGRDCITCPVTLTPPSQIPGPYAVYAGLYYFSNFEGRNVAQCNKSNGFEIECVYDVITGAYVGDLVLCAPTAQTGKDLTPSPLPPLFSPKAEVNPYVVCNAAPVQPIQEAVCRANLKTLNTACRGLDAASTILPLCIPPGLFPNSLQQTLLAAGDRLTRDVLNIPSTGTPLEPGQNQFAYQIFFASIQSTLAAAGLAAYDNVDRALRDVKAAFTYAESKICGLIDSSFGVIGPADYCSQVYSTYYRACNGLVPGEFPPFGASKRNLQIDKRDANPCTEFCLSAIGPYLPDCPAVYALGNGQDCSAVASTLQSAQDVEKARKTCEIANSVTRGAQELCAIYTAVKAIESRCYPSTAPPTPSQPTVRRQKEKRRLDGQYWNPDAKHWAS